MLEPTNGRPAVTEALRKLRRPPPVPSTPERKRGLMAEWRRLARSLDDPSVELTPDTVAPLLLCYQRMVAAGCRIDAMASALVRQMAYQLATSEAFLDG